MLYRSSSTMVLPHHEKQEEDEENDAIMEIGDEKKIDHVKRVCHQKAAFTTDNNKPHMTSLHQKLIITTFNREPPPPPATDRGDITAMKKKSSCVICGRNFQSTKSLSGHMRCHPDRDWRGINPPPTKIASSSSSSSSDFDPLGTDGDRNDSSNKRDRAVDLRESLRGWAVTAKRGLKGTAAAELTMSEDDGLNEVVNFLMMLARGKNCGDDQSMKKKKKKKRKRKKAKLCDLKLIERKGMTDFDVKEVPPLEADQLVLHTN